jgi:hypothetical protein
MSSAQPRFLTTLGLALVIVGTGLGVFYFQRGSNPSSSKNNGVDSSVISDEQKIADAEKRIFASVPEKQAAYEKAFGELKAAGIVHSTSLPTLESIHRREEMVKRFDAANTALEEVFKNAEKTLRAALLRQGFSDYTSARAAARFAQRANVDLILKIRACDRESNQLFLQILDLLDIRFGAWTPTAEDHLRFNKSADADTYTALRRQIAAIGATEQTAQVELQQRLQDTAKPKP